MLLLLRILLTGLFLGLLARLAGVPGDGVESDLEGAGWLALSVIVGIAAACTWAPVFGERVAGPLTGVMTDGSVRDVPHGWMPAIRGCVARRWRRLAVFLCVLEGIRDPHQPGPFLLGMAHSGAGSWWERAFAREVFRFSNARNCMQAREILRVRHGQDPGVHHRPEVEIALRTADREPRPGLPPLPIPGSEPVPLPSRNPRIRLFRGAGNLPGPNRSGP